MMPRPIKMPHPLIYATQQVISKNMRTNIIIYYLSPKERESIFIVIKKLISLY